MKKPSTAPGTTKSKEKIIEEQIQKWQQAHERRRKQEQPKPIITISRQMGSNGRNLAEEIAEELGMDIFDREIIQSVADSIHMSERVVATLDERMPSSLENWIQILKTTRYLWPDKYRTHLTKVIGTIVEHGNAVIIGRGAQHLVPADEVLRIRFVAPMPFRIETIVEQENVSPEEAEHMITKREADSRAYIREHFHVDIDDPTYYDLIINTQYINQESILDMVKLSLKYKQYPSRRRFDAAEAAKES